MSKLGVPGYCTINLIVYILMHSHLMELCICALRICSAGALNMALPYGPAVVDHCILTAGLAPQQQLKHSALRPEQQQALLAAVLAWERWLDDCETRAPKGYITYRRAGTCVCVCVCVRRTAVRSQI